MITGKKRGWQMQQQMLKRMLTSREELLLNRGCWLGQVFDCDATQQRIDDIKRDDEALVPLCRFLACVVVDVDVKLNAVFIFGFTGNSMSRPGCDWSAAIAEEDEDEEEEEEEG
jgi:hypothetical protein